MFKKVIFGILTIGMLTGSTCDPQVMEDVLNTVIGTTITEQEAANGLKEAKKMELRLAQIVENF